MLHFFPVHLFRIETAARLWALPLSLLLFASCALTPRPLEEKSKVKELDAYFAEHDIHRFASSPPKLYFSGEAWRARALRLVEGAKDYILISSFLFNAGPIDEELLSALARKAAEGVRVYLMFDSSSYFTYLPDLESYEPTALARFAGTNVEVAEYNPMAGHMLFDLPTLLDRDHRKFWIVDGEYFATGGMNINYYSLSPPGPDTNIDTFVEVRSEGIARSMVASFCETWNHYSPKPLDPASFNIPPGGIGSSLWLVDQKVGEDSKVDALIDLFLQKAEREVWLVQSYSFMTPALDRKIAAACSRGVKVNLVISTNSLRPVYEKAARYCMQNLLKDGASVYVFDSPQKAFLHYKLFFADDELSAFGSPNLNFRSEYLSREIALVSADPAVAAKTRANLKGILAHSRKIGEAEARTWRSLEYGLAYFLMLFGG